MKVEIDEHRTVWFMGLDNKWHSYGKKDGYLNFKVVEDNIYEIHINGEKIPVDRQTFDDFHRATTWN